MTTWTYIDFMMSLVFFNVVAFGSEPWSKGCEFESHHQTLEGHFFRLMSCKNYIVCLKRRYKKRKRDREWPIKRVNQWSLDGWLSRWTLLLK